MGNPGCCEELVCDFFKQILVMHIGSLFHHNDLVVFLVLCDRKLLLNKPMGKVDGKSLFLKDSCDGSGLNTSENSKDYQPLG